VRVQARSNRDSAESAARVGSSYVVVRFTPGVAGEPRSRPTPSATVSGVVLDVEGRPVDNAYVTAAGEVRGCESWAEGTKSDPEGRFSVSTRLEGPCRISVYSLTPPGQAEISGVAPGSIGLTVRLEAHATIRGRVLVPQRWVPPDACVSAWRVGEASAGEYDDDFPSPDGRFVIDDLARGAYRLAVRAGALVGETEDAVVVSPGDVRRGVDVRLREGARIEGQVVEANGRAVDCARVGAEHPFRLLPPPVDTDTAGRFRLEGLLPGSWTLHVKCIETGASASTTTVVGTEGTVTVVVSLP